jgi:hypothetical protein
MEEQKANGSTAQRLWSQRSSLLATSTIHLRTSHYIKAEIAYIGPPHVGHAQDLHILKLAFLNDSPLRVVSPYPSHWSESYQITSQERAPNQRRR